jgi:hypothetical protein
VYGEAERRTPCPLVHVQAKGKETLFIVDTGATANALTKWFAEDLGITTTSHAEDAARDFAGTALEVARAGPLDITADGTVIGRGFIPVVATPILARPRGIGGVLSPRLLLRPNFVAVLDLPADRLAVVEGALQGDPWKGEKSLARDGTRACGTRGIYLVPAALDGASALLRLDTGSEQTSVFAASAIGQALSSRMAVAPGAQSSVGQEFGQKDGVSFEAGRVTAKLSVRLIPGEPSAACKYDGLLGMDALRGCQIILDPDRAFARCE